MKYLIGALWGSWGTVFMMAVWNHFSEDFWGGVIISLIILCLVSPTLICFALND